MNLAVLVALAVTLIVFGVRLIRNQRRWAALLSYGLYVLLPVSYTHLDVYKRQLYSITTA